MAHLAVNILATKIIVYHVSVVRYLSKFWHNVQLVELVVGLKHWFCTSS